MIRHLGKLLATAAAFTAMALAPASAAMAVTPGAFCSNASIGSIGYSSDGDSYICAKHAGDNQARWYPLGSGGGSTPTPTATAPVTPTATPTGYGTHTATPTKPTPKATPTDGATLPVTGYSTPIVAGSGVLLMAGGIGILRAVRRRKSVKFTA